MKNRVWRGIVAAGRLLCVAGLSSVQAAENVPRFVANSYINLGTPAALQIPSNNPLTVEGWVKLDTPLTETAMLYSKGAVRTSPYSYMFGLTGTGTKMAAYTGEGGKPANTWVEVLLPAKLLTGRWYHLAFAFDGAYLSFLLDGVCIGRRPYNFANYTAHTVKIGGYVNGTDILGNISDVRVWNHARSRSQIGQYRNRRLNGSESGLLGYWPLNEGAGTTVYGRTSAGNGTLTGSATWISASDLTLTAASPDYLLAMPFTLADRVTGSTRFTNSNQVDVVDLPIPAGCNYYQFTASGGVTDIDPDGWLFTNVPTALLTFAVPVADTNFQSYAWFTNTTAAALVQRAESSIFYTTVLPVPAVRATLAIQRLPAQNVIINGADLDVGSTGGVANGVTLGIDLYDASGANPGDDQTPGESYVTLAAEGIYPLLLRVRNEAGNAITAMATCMVTVTASAINTNLWTGAGGNALWHNPANWSAGVPAAGQNVAIRTGSGTRLTGPTPMLNSFVLGASRGLTVEGWASALKSVDLTIQGIVAHTNNNVITEDWVTWVPQHRILLEGSNISVASGATLDADWKGFRKNQGPGTPIGGTAGAGHAGQGGHGDGAVGGAAYGEPAMPTQPGSGGGLHAQSSEGGGAIRISAAGQLAVYGTIKANGRNALSTHGGGGSGGSIWLSCRTLAGSSQGIVQAKGGNGNHFGGPGSAGRIAVDYDSDAQAALPDPRPAIRFDGTPGAPTVQNREQLRAAMATLHLPDTLLVENNFTSKRLLYVQVAVDGWSQWRLNSLSINDCVIGVQSGVDLVVTNDLVLTNNAALHLFAGPVTNVLTDVGVALSVGGSLRLFTGTWIVPVCDPTNGATVAVSVGGDLQVVANAGFDADMRGYTRSYGPGTTRDAYGAGGHGGNSGMAFGGKMYGHAYGDAALPVLAGSGGSSSTLAGRGGGAIRLQVAGRAVVHGTLTAKGGKGTTTHGGAGSGGTILLQCNTLEGSNSGLLSVDGGWGNYYGGSGGGGRIAVHYNAVAQAALAEPVPPVRFSAYAYPFTDYLETRYTINAQVGTLWLPNTLFISETLDRQRFWHVRLVIPGFTSWAPAGLTVNNCILTWPEGFTLTVANDLVLTNGAAMTLIAAATNTPSQRYGAQLVVGRDLVVATNSWIYPQAHPTNAVIVGLRVGRNATLNAGGGIDAAGRGYHASNVGQIGPGEGGNGYIGGGYGGKGGGGVLGGAVYGKAALPLLPGSAAGWNPYGGALGYTVGGNGGGAVHLRVGGDLRVDGVISADGWHGSYYQGGGGSGGAILLAVRRLVGGGTVRAKGGASHSNIAAGGGGRIAIWHHMTPGEVEARLAAQSSAGLLYAASHPAFTGTLDVGWYGTSTGGLPGEGSKGFYTQVSTLIIIR
jgi:hypothetical protein